MTSDSYSAYLPPFYIRSLHPGRSFSLNLRRLEIKFDGLAAKIFVGLEILAEQGLRIFEVVSDGAARAHGFAALDQCEDALVAKPIALEIGDEWKSAAAAFGERV